jgi:hypothetical protein
VENYLGRWGFTAVGAVALVIAAYAPSAAADNIVIQNNTGCASGISGICVGGSTPYSLTDVLNGTEALVEPGTSETVLDSTVPTYIVTNDTGSTTIQLTFDGELANNAFLDCQENGGFSNDSCSISGSLGTVGTGAQYGPPAGQTTSWDPHVTITFTGVAIGSTFDLTFSSFAHANDDQGDVVATTPEPSDVLLLIIGLLGVSTVGFLRRKQPA